MKKGFSLIEILITISILAIIAGVAIPSFRASKIKHEAAQARTYLRTLQLAETMYYSKHGFYQPDLGALGVDITGSPYDYAIDITAGDPSADPPTSPTFVITATHDTEPEIEIGEDGNFIDD